MTATLIKHFFLPPVPTGARVGAPANDNRYLRLATSVLVAAERPDGQAINFHCNTTSHVCTPDTPNMDYSLSSSSTTWTLTDPALPARAPSTLSSCATVIRHDKNNTT
jgi:hypothetical protein